MNIRFNPLGCIPLISNGTKIAISICLLIIAIMSYLVFPQSLDRKICLIAMLLSFLGDISLNSTPLQARTPTRMCIGAICFMCAHLGYALAYYTLIGNFYKYFNPGVIVAFIFIFLLFFIAIICIIKKKHSLGIPLALVFSSYIVIIGINFTTICSYSWSSKSLSFIGALSFLISDFIIGIETVFKIKNDTLRKLVWIFYPIGQILIIVCR